MEHQLKNGIGQYRLKRTLWFAIENSGGSKFDSSEAIDRLPTIKSRKKLYILLGMQVFHKF